MAYSHNMVSKRVSGHSSITYSPSHHRAPVKPPACRPHLPELAVQVQSAGNPGRRQRAEEHFLFWRRQKCTVINTSMDQMGQWTKWLW